MEECWRRLSLPTMEKELIDKWYTCIFLHNKSAGLYISRMKKRFLNDEGGMVLALELLEAKRKDVNIFPVKDIICRPLQMNPLRGGRWKCPSYEIVTKVKKIETCYITTLFVMKLVDVHNKLAHKEDSFYYFIM